MQFFKNLLAKIKLFFGIGTVGLTLEIPATFSEQEGSISGTLTITGKSDQTINDVKIELIEEFSKKNSSGEVKHSTFTLGEIHENRFEIKSGEEKKINFKLPFALVKSMNDQMQEHGGALGAFAKLGSLAAGEKSKYSVKAVVDVEASTFDPVKSVQIMKA